MYKKYLILLFLFVIFGSSAQSTNRKYSSYKAYLLDGSKNKMFSTDLFIKKGDSLSIKASGSISFGAFSGKAGPNGFTNGAFQSYNYVRGANHGALLCRFQENKNDWYIVGTEGTIIAPIDSHINFLINDREYNNNSGCYIVYVTVYR